MTSSVRLLAWILIGAAVITGGVAAFIYRDEISTFIVARGVGGGDQLVFLATVETDDAHKNVTKYATGPGATVTYNAHFFTPRAANSYRGNVVIDPNEFYLTNISKITKGCSYDRDKITCPVSGKAAFGRFSFSAVTQLPSVAQPGATTRIALPQFTVKADFCLDRSQCISRTVEGDISQAIRGRALGMSLKASVQGGGAAKPGKTLIYDLTLTNNSKQPITVSGSALWPALLSPSVVQQPYVVCVPGPTVRCAAPGFSTTGSISFEGRQMTMSGVTIPAGGSVKAQLSALLGSIKKGQAQYVEITATADNGDSARTGEIIKGNFVLIEITAGP